MYTEKQAIGNWCWWIVWDDKGLWAHTMDLGAYLRYMSASENKSKHIFFQDAQEYRIFYEWGKVTVSRKNNKNGGIINVPQNWALT